MNINSQYKFRKDTCKFLSNFYAGEGIVIFVEVQRDNFFSVIFQSFFKCVNLQLISFKMILCESTQYE